MEGFTKTSGTLGLPGKNFRVKVVNPGSFGGKNFGFL